MLQDCGHDVADDEALVRADAMAPAAGQDAPESGPQCTVLAWDERMTMHAEGRHNPHPERPDRLRAVMARLLDSGLAGACLGRISAAPSGTSRLNRDGFSPSALDNCEFGARCPACCHAWLVCAKAAAKVHLKIGATSVPACLCLFALNSTLCVMAPEKLAVSRRARVRSQMPLAPGAARGAVRDRGVPQRGAGGPGGDRVAGGGRRDAVLHARHVRERAHGDLRRARRRRLR